MKKKNVIFCLFAVLVLTALPVVSSSSTIAEVQTVQKTEAEKNICEVQETPESAEMTGYLLIHVYTWFPLKGFHPYPAANISVKGFFYSYNGTTDENGDCLLRLHTNLLRAKMYFIKVSIIKNDRVVTRRTSIFIEPRDIIYKEFMFIMPGS